MRSLTEREVDLLQSSEYRAHFKVYFEDADGNMEEITNYEGKNWVESIEISTDIDTEGKSFIFNIKRNRNKRTFSPLMKGSPFNVVNQEYKPKLFMGRKFLIEIAITDLNANPEEEWWDVFERGFIDRISFQSDPIMINGTCDSGDLLRKYIKKERNYGSDNGQPVEIVMQQILNDNGMSNYTLITPKSPNWNLLPYTQRKERVYDALRELAHQIGWELRPRYYNPTEDIELVFYEPNRNPEEVGWSFNSGDYTQVNRIEMGMESIRNRVRIVYSDANVEDEDGEPGKRQVVERFDQDSIDQFGELFMEISEASISNINTASEATTLAENSLHDLKEPKADQEIESNFFYPIQLHDYVEFQPNGVHFDRVQNFGVIGYRHNINLEEGKLRTTLTTRGRPNMSSTGYPTGLSRAWLQREAIFGIAPINRETPPAQPQNIVTHSYIKGITVAWASQRSEETQGYNVYCSNEPGFEVSGDKVVARGSNTQFTITTFYNESAGEIEQMTSGEVYYIKLRGYSTDYQLGEVSIEVSEIAGKLGAADVEDGSVNSDKTVGATGTFTTSDDKTTTVTNGLITSIN